jgi:nitric oxide reductase subunit B
MAFLLMKLTGIERDVVEKWLYVEVGLVLFTGIVGTGHHYFWIGTPTYWLLLGGVFSALEPVPIALMVMDAWRMGRHAPRPHPNRIAWTWALGGTVAHLLGAGVWGFAQTLPQINRWTHGTQITPAHGHFAFYGAYAMLVIALIYFMVPQINNALGKLNYRRALVAFWCITSGVVGMVLSLTVAGIIQIYMQRMAGIDFMVVKTQYMNFWFILRLTFGTLAVIGVILYVWDFLSLGFGVPREESSHIMPRAMPTPGT